MIHIKNLTKKYVSGKEFFYALDNVSLSCEKGEIVAILGPSGSGKSTLMNIIGGIDNLDSGSVKIFDSEIQSFNNKALTNYRRQNIGFIFQFYNLIPNLTVRENIEVVSDISSNPLDITDILTTLGINEHSHKYPSELSGGQQQRTAIARAIVKNPKILLCDEPTGALDYKSSIDVLDAIKTLNSKYNTTILIVTHNESISKMCHRIVKLSSGKIVSNKINENIISAGEIKW